MRALITTDVELCADKLRSGQLVAFGTETVYGLGANALDSRAVAQIFQVKKRPAFDPLIVHVSNLDQMQEVAHIAHSTIEKVAERFWPGPLTLLLPKSPRISDLVTSGLPEVGIRIPAHPLALDLIKKAGVPVAAPSANLFGRLSPTTAEHVAEQLGDQIDWILDGGPCAVGVESTVLRIPLDGPAQILRPGGTRMEDLRELLGTVELAPSLLDGQQPAAPGQLHSHYAPRCPLRVVLDWNLEEILPSTGLLCFQQCPPQFQSRPSEQIEVLSKPGDLTEAAANLFSALRRLDAAGCNHILAEAVPAEGLGLAINDRLRRAASSSHSPN